MFNDLPTQNKVAVIFSLLYCLGVLMVIVGRALGMGAS